MERRIFRFLILAACLLIFYHRGFTTPNNSALDSTKVTRLASFCKLWGTLKYFHPYLAYRSIDWDSAFVYAAKEVEESKGSADYRNAIQDLIGALADPTTRVLNSSNQDSSNAGRSSPRWRFTADSILIVTIDKYSDLLDFYGASQKLREAGKEMSKSRGVVFDLRLGSAVSEYDRGSLDYDFKQSGLPRKLSKALLKTPGQRGLMYLGFPPERGNTSGQYSSAFCTVNGAATSADTDAIEKPVVFLLNENSDIPSVALGLQSAGKAAIIADGKIDEASFVNTSQFDAGEGIIVEYRLGEIVREDGSGGLSAITVSSSRMDGQEALDSAVSLARKGDFQRAQNPPLPACSYLVSHNQSDGALYPSTELRLLAAAKIWVIFNYFFPDKSFLSEDWAATPRDFIPDLISARDSLEYALTIARMITRVHDTHAFIRSKVLEQYYGVASPPIVVRLVEDQPIVVSFLDDSIASASGIKIGDIIERIDGEKALDRIDRYRRYIAASTPQWRNSVVCEQLLNGPDSSVATLTVRDENNIIKKVTLVRSKSYADPYGHWRNGDILKLLPNNIGYADLDRMPAAMVDSMFDKFKNTKAIILDMRGYPSGTAWQIAPRLTDKDKVSATTISRPTVMYPDGSFGNLESADKYTFVIPLPNPIKPRYSGKTVMLIDERTVSQAEYSGLFYHAANGTKFIGTNTAGAGADVTNFFVPGGIRIYFSGQIYTYPDGTPVMGIGLVPDVRVSPTIKGIREGNDEILEKAIQYVQGELSN